jgi:hypothetical protein
VTVLALSAADQPGTLGFLVVFGMGIILFFLFRSMAKHLRKVSSGTGDSGAPADLTQASRVPDEPGTGSAPGSSGHEF